MENVEIGDTLAKRNPIACEACRTSKTRCFPSEQAGICKRCNKSKLNCVSRTVLQPKRAQRQQRTKSQKNDAVDIGNNVEFHLELPATSYPNVSDRFLAMGKHHEEVFNEHQKPGIAKDNVQMNDVAAQPTPPSSFFSSQSPTNLEVLSTIPKRILSLRKAVELYAVFKEMSVFFPFVIIPPESTVPSLASNSPFLLLALLTAAASSEATLHHQLNHEFRRVLSAKVIVDGRRSLDYLQGLLVYLAWYPSYIKLGHRESFMYMNLAVSISMDLGLDRGNQAQPSSSSFSHQIETKNLYENGHFSKDAQRAYLGAFYLSTAVSWFTLKQSLIDHDDVVEDYSTSLGEHISIPSDASIPPLVASIVLEERVRLSLRSPSLSLSIAAVPHFDAQGHVRDIDYEVDKWRRNIPASVLSLAPIAHTMRALEMVASSYDLALIRLPRSERQYIINSPSYLAPHVLTKCLQSIKTYLEFILLPSSLLQYFTTVQWGYLIRSIVILYKLSFPLENSPQWDAKSAREFAPLGMYLDSLCYRLMGISNTQCPVSKDASVQEVPRNPDMPFMIRMVLETLKHTYDRRVTELTSSKSGLWLDAQTPETYLSNGFEDIGSFSRNSHTSDGAGSSGNASHARKVPNFRNGSNCPIFDGDVSGYFNAWQQASSEVQNISNFAGGESVFNGDFPSMEERVKSDKSKAPVYFDIWATMTMSWANEQS